MVFSTSACSYEYYMAKRNKASAKEIYFQNKKQNYQYRHQDEEKAAKITKKRRGGFARKAKKYHQKVARYNRLMKQAKRRGD